MVAFTEPPQESGTPPHLHHAHHLLAATLLSRPTDRLEPARPIAVWKAWMMVGWLVLTAAWALFHATSVLLPKGLGIGD